MAANRTVLDVLLASPRRDIHRDDDLLAARITGVGRFVFHRASESSQALYRPASKWLLSLAQ